MATSMIVRSIYETQPPDLQTKVDMNPTLLVSWWCTGFALAAIIIRVLGRWVRTEKLFREDWIVFGSILPLLIRMGLVHVILIWGTNNTKTHGLTPTAVHHREIGSKLVLASRILYAIFIWMSKWSILEFLKRLVGAFWHKSYEIGLQIIRYFLVATFIAVLVATLAECHPFDHYWQVIPDPGPKCREGLAQLITMGSCDIVTDLVLVAFPIPIVIKSEMPLKRKISLVLLFALSLGLVGVTGYRVPATISRRSAQQFRSLLASVEILAASAVTNAIVIGSFIRDRGVKKAKFKPGSTGDNSLERTSTRRTTITAHHWGSDEDLVRELGMSVHPSLQSGAVSGAIPPHPPPVAIPNHNAPGDMMDENGRTMTINPTWSFPNAAHAPAVSDKASISSTSTNPKLAEIDKQHLTEPVGPSAAPEREPKKVSFFDVGGLADDSKPSSGMSTEDNKAAYVGQRSPQTSRRSSRAFISDVGGLLSSHREEEDMDRSTALPPAARRGSTQRSQQQPGNARNFSRGSSAYTRGEHIAGQDDPTPPYRPGRDVGGPISGTSGTGGQDSMDFVDAGGLLR